MDTEFKKYKINGMTIILKHLPMYDNQHSNVKSIKNAVVTFVNFDFIPESNLNDYDKEKLRRKELLRLDMVKANKKLMDDNINFKDAKSILNRSKRIKNIDDGWAYVVYDAVTDSYYHVSSGLQEYEGNIYMSKLTELGKIKYKL